MKQQQPLHALPYDEQLARLQLLAEAAIHRYGLRGASRPELLQYENNAVYEVATGVGERFVLRIATARGRGVHEQRAELRWLAALARETTARVPEPIANLSGELVSPLVSGGVETNAAEDVAESYPSVLFRWVPGEPPSQGVAGAAMECMGAVTAELHRHAERFVARVAGHGVAGRGAQFARPRWDWERLFGASSVFGDEPAISKLDAPTREALSAAGREVRGVLEARPLERGLIHADLHRDNLLVHGEDVGVIDFDDCGWGYFGFDIASVLDSFYRRVAADTADYARLRSAYLRGYERVRPLPFAGESELRAFKAMRDMVNIDFMLRSKNANVLAWGHERLDRFVAQLRAYADHSSSFCI